MDLKTVLEALLPSGSREHVLGDLEERGFRLRDVANVLPRVWWSYWVRQWNGPPFVAAGASDAALRRRAQQFARRRNFFRAVCTALIIVWGSDWIHKMPSHSHSAAEPRVSFLLCVSIGILIHRAIENLNAPPASDRHLWLKRHQEQLTYALWGSQSPIQFPLHIRFVIRCLRILFYVVLFDKLLWPAPAAPGEPWFFRALLLLEILVVFLWERRHERRIQVELEHLKSALT